MQDFIMESLPDRKRPAHWAGLENGNQSVLYFVTVCTKHRQPVLATEAMHECIVSAWKTAEFWKVGRYVIMPDHIHLFCSPATYPPHPFRRWVGFWKNTVARNFDGTLWQRDIWDTQLRKGDSYTEKWQYVVNNPVRASLASKSNDWPYQGEIEPLWWHD
ncbi:MAG: transposase [Lentimonas sp.]